METRGLVQADENLEFQPPFPTTGYDTLEYRDLQANQPADFSFRPNADYERYLKIHKVFVGQKGAEQLQEIHTSLRREYMPRYLSAAGWAAAEAALIRSDIPTRDRLALIDDAISCWSSASINQRYMNSHGPEHVLEYALPHRMALDIAISPLLKGIVLGNVSEEMCRQVFHDCLNVAQSNAVQIEIMARAGCEDGVAEHLGLGYECNALLAFNRRFSKTWFVIPSMVRSDSGHYHRRQTHDLLVVHQRWGELIDVAPVEIKSAATVRDRQRYKALLVRGKMHLSVEGKFTPEHTLNAIAACYEGIASRREAEVADSISNRFMTMTKDYYAGKRLTELATAKSCTHFHEGDVVAARHPGLTVAV